MKGIVIIGAGGLAREVKFLIDEINKIEKKFDFRGYLVSDLDKLSEYDSKDEVLGDFSWFIKNKQDINVAIGIGNPSHRLKVGKEISDNYANTFFPSLIHPNVIYDRASCEIGKGAIVCSSTIMTVNVKLKDYSFINLCCTIGHEAIIGYGSVLNPTVNISGGVSIGEGVLIGTGAQILQYLKIGANSIVGAGACITKSVPKNEVWGGVPAKLLKTR